MASKSNTFLINTPVWTAFVDPRMLRPKRNGSRKVRLDNVRLHIFVNREEYDEQSQRRGEDDLFEIEFASERYAIAFLDILRGLRK